jgi:hypothetical protein
MADFIYQVSMSGFGFGNSAHSDFIYLKWKLEEKKLNSNIWEGRLSVGK